MDPLGWWRWAGYKFRFGVKKNCTGQSRRIFRAAHGAGCSCSYTTYASLLHQGYLLYRYLGGDPVMSGSKHLLKLQHEKTPRVDSQTNVEKMEQVKYVVGNTPVRLHTYRGLKTPVWCIGRLQVGGDVLPSPYHICILYHRDCLDKQLLQRIMVSPDPCIVVYCCRRRRPPLAATDAMASGIPLSSLAPSK